MPGTFPLALSEYLDYLPGYDLTDQLSEMLDPARAIIESENYFMQGFVFPLNGSDTVAGLTTFEGLINIPAHSIIVYMSGFSNQAAGFKFQLYENGSKQLLYGRTYAFKNQAGGYLGEDGNLNLDEPVGPSWLNAPFIVMPPGRLNGSVTNLSPNSALIQMYFNVAIPITRETLSQSGSKKGL